MLFYLVVILQQSVPICSDMKRYVAYIIILHIQDFSILPNFKRRGSTSSSTAFSLMPSWTAMALTPIGLSAFSNIFKYFA